MYNSNRSTMKKRMNCSGKTFLTALMFFTISSSFGQTTSDTVNTGKTNDAMVINPGMPNDSLAVNPGETNDEMVAMSDTGFINKNISDNLMEIQLSKMGRNKSTSPAVKKVAGQMITDHTAILNDLRRLAAKNGAGAGNSHAMPHMMPSETPKGANFNAKWASLMLTMHEAKIAELEKFMTATQNAGIKAAISKALPKIKAHTSLLAKLPGAKVTEDPNSVIQ